MRIETQAQYEAQTAAEIRLAEFLAEQIRNSVTYFGYPEIPQNNDLAILGISGLAKLHLNNAGDPSIHGNSKMHTKELKRRYWPLWQICMNQKITGDISQAVVLRETYTGLTWEEITSSFKKRNPIFYSQNRVITPFQKTLTYWISNKKRYKVRRQAR